MTGARQKKNSASDQEDLGVEKSALITDILIKMKAFKKVLMKISKLKDDRIEGIEDTETEDRTGGTEELMILIRVMSSELPFLSLLLILNRNKLALTRSAK